MRRHIVIAAVSGIVILLAGCTDDSLATQFREGSNKGYISGDGAVTEYPADARGEPVTFTGSTTHGTNYRSDDVHERVQVVNFWYAGCAPCRAEASLLQRIHNESQARGVSFVGVNVRDQAETARSFEQSYGVTYPSILDDGSVQLAFAERGVSSAVPTTLVLDKKGRVSAKILGQLSSVSVLNSLIDRVVSE